MLRPIIYSSLLSYLTAIFSFLSTMVIAKNIHIDIFGIVTLGLAIGAFIQILLNFASDKIFIKEVINDGLDAFSYVMVQVIFQLFIFISILIIYTQFFTYQNLILYVIIWLSLIGMYPKSFYDYKEKILQNTFIHFIERLLSFLFIFIYIYIKNQDIDILKIEFLFKMLIITRVIFIILQLFLIFKKVPYYQYKFSIITFNKNIGKRLYLVIALLSNSIILYGLQIMTKIQLDYKSIAIYGLSIQLTLIVIIVQAQVIRHLNKKIFVDTKNSKFNKKSFTKTLILSTCISFPLSLMMLVLSYLLENYYLNSSYNGLFNISVILSIWVIILGAGIIISQYFISLLNEKMYFYINLSGGITAIILSYIAFDFFGIYTAPLILLVIHSSIILTQYIFIIKKEDNVK